MNKDFVPLGKFSDYDKVHLSDVMKFENNGMNWAMVSFVIPHHELPWDEKQGIDAFRPKMSAYRNGLHPNAVFAETSAQSPADVFSYISEAMKIMSAENRHLVFSFFLFMKKHEYRIMPWDEWVAILDIRNQFHRAREESRQKQLS